MTAQDEYSAARFDLEEYAKNEAGMTVYILTGDYPIEVHFTPDQPKQQSLFDNAEGLPVVDENGEIGCIIAEIGIKSSVKATIDFKLPSDVLKKLIKKAEKTAHLYLHAFREKMQSEVDPLLLEV